MKLFYFVAALAILGSGSVKAQNVQFHYDLGHSLSKNLTTRPSVTTTVEMFKPDRWGNTFFFIDLDYYSRGMAGAYWEISREFDLSKNKQFAAHIEYNGGVSTAEDMTYASRFQQAVLVGPAWNWHSADFSKTFSVQTLYKYYFRGQHDEHAFSSFQLTGVWSSTFAKGLCTFSGYFDLWYDDKVNGILFSWVSLNSGSTSTPCMVGMASTSVWVPNWKFPTTSYTTIWDSTIVSMLSQP